MSPSVAVSTDVPFGVLLLYGIFKGAPSLYFKSLLGAAKLSVCGKGLQNISAIEAVMNQGETRMAEDGEDLKGLGMTTSYYTYMFCTCVLPWRFSSQVKLYS